MVSVSSIRTSKQTCTTNRNSRFRRQCQRDVGATLFLIRALSEKCKKVEGHRAILIGMAAAFRDAARAHCGDVGTQYSKKLRKINKQHSGAPRPLSTTHGLPASEPSAVHATSGGAFGTSRSGSAVHHTSAAAPCPRGTRGRRSRSAQLTPCRRKNRRRYMRHRAARSGHQHKGQ